MKELDLELSHISKHYERPILRDINLRVTNGDFVAIVGKSGAGKSTLLNILGLLDDYDGGEYRLNGTTIRKGIDYARLRLQTIGFIFQSYNLIPTLSCEENILLPAMYAKREAGAFEELVSVLKLSPLLRQSVVTMSGGEKQRTAIARALLLDPCLILADEPTGNLDAQNRDMVIEMLLKEQQKGRGIILITHDLHAAEAASRIYQLEGGMLHAI